MCVTRPAQSPPAWHALRATRPPIEWPISTICSIGTGQPAASSSSDSASERPFSEMWRPELNRTYTGVKPCSDASRSPYRGPPP